MKELKSLLDSFYEMYFEVHKYFVKPSGEPNILGKIFKIAGILIVGRLLISIIYKLLDRSSELTKDKTIQEKRRAKTIRNIMKSIMKALIYFYCAMSILEIFNIDTKSIIATAGVGGIAIGFGAQSLVKDIITGFFILQDNLYSVGDYVTIRGYEGTVESLGLRITKIRDLSGELHIIPNGEVHIISNSSRGGVRALVKIEIAYEEDIDEAIDILEDALIKVNREFDKYLYLPAYIRGIDDLTDAGVEIRIEAMVEAMKKWDMERAMRRAIKDGLEKADIEIPYPRLVTIKGENL